MSSSPGTHSVFPAHESADLEALFEGAPVLVTPHDLANEALIPDETEYLDFLASYRADRQRDLD